MKCCESNLGIKAKSFESKSKSNFFSLTSYFAFFALLMYLSSAVSAYSVYDFTTNPSTLTTNTAYYPVAGKVLSTTKTVFVNYGGVDYNTPFDPYALDYFAVVPLAVGTNTITVRVVDASSAVVTTTKQVIYDPAYSTASRELIYVNAIYYKTFSAYSPVVVIVDTKKNALVGAFPEKVIDGITPDGKRFVLSGEWYSTTNNASTGSSVPNYVSGADYISKKILFSSDGYAYYQNYKLNLSTNVATQMKSTSIIGRIASISSDNSAIAYYNDSSSQGFLNTSTFALTSANFNPNNGVYFDNLAITPDKKYIISTTAGGGAGGIAIMQYSNTSNYSMYSSCGDWASEIIFSPDKSKAYVTCSGNSYYGGGGVEVIDLATLSVNGKYTLFGAGSAAVTSDGRVITEGTIAYNTVVNGNVAAHGIYELSLNSAGTGFDVNKVYFVNLSGNVALAGIYHSPVQFMQGNIFVKNGAVTCSSNSDCGSNGQTGATFCQSGNVYINYATYTCNSPGTSASYCSSKSTPQLKETCTKGCVAGACSADMNGIKIINGKIAINGNEFMIKGLDYAPWLVGTGPDPTRHSPFPANRTDDVTARVTNGNGVIIVKDYSGDGKIQAWEVIKYDVETMKKLGANTIRTYASASWHDKDLDGVIDTSTNPNVSEIVQGDMHDWMLDELLADAQANNMKVIIGYWVQEENFKETPLVANWDDLPVAKQAFGRVVQKYKSNPAVLGWGIGNEVNGNWNQGWFSWGVPVNDYLNALFDYTKSLDTTHPVIYAKYIGENTTFNNMRVDIMSINAYLHSAQELVNYGEFSVPAPSGKAYMLGEYGHDLTQADAHWALSQNYAGGAFLEYNNVWWKGDGQNLLGVVDEYRAANTERYAKVYALYGGAPICSTNLECGTNYYDANTCSGNNVVRVYNQFTCINPGTSSASCQKTQSTQTLKTCTNGCSNGACIQTIACTTNAQCGTDAWVSGTNSCSNNDVFQNFISYKCNNPGTVSSSCSNSTSFILKTDCGDTTYGTWSANYCDANLVVKSRQVNNKGCSAGFCNDFASTETQTVQTCTNGCSNGKCVVPIACSTNAQCGTNGTIGTVCNANSVYNVNRTYTCNLAGTASSYCSFKDANALKQTCSYGCSNGACITPATCGFNNGVLVSVETTSSTAWDIEKVVLKVKYGVFSTKTITKYGNAFISSQGNYLTTNHCTASTCSWVSGTLAVVGPYESTPSTWGGKLTYKFDLTGIDPTKVKSLTVEVYRPNVYGKGLHSPLNTGSGKIWINNVLARSQTTNVNKCGTDWFGHSCSTTVLNVTKTPAQLGCIAG